MNNTFMQPLHFRLVQSIYSNKCSGNNQVQPIRSIFGSGNLSSSGKHYHIPVNKLQLQHPDNQKTTHNWWKYAAILLAFLAVILYYCLHKEKNENKDLIKKINALPTTKVV